MNEQQSFKSSEDFAVLCIGALVLFLTLGAFLIICYSNLSSDIERTRAVINEGLDDPVRSVEWYEAKAKLKGLQASKTAFGSWMKKWSGKPGSWKNNPVNAVYISAEKAERIRESVADEHASAKLAEATSRDAAEQAYQEARSTEFIDEEKNQAAQEAISIWQSALERLGVTKNKYDAKASAKWPFLLALLALFLLLFGGAQALRGVKFKTYAPGFFYVFVIACIAYLLAGQASVKNLGIGYAAWAILLGLIISNTMGTPTWVKKALTTELYIKTGLVLLGAEILFGKILAIGLPGIFVAWVVTPIVLLSTYWFGQKVLKISSQTLNITISADMSVCGVSAAVATAAASKATKEELTLAIGLSMVFTSVMMIVLPIVINALGLPEVLGGAWIGGTIDATGAVVAAGAFLGDDALNVAATIKMIQNVLIGIIAFGVAIYFAKMEGVKEKVEIGWGEIWRRFPKFILGFIGASIIFSIIYQTLSSDLAYSLLDQGVLGGFTKNIRGWLFCLAFVSIGLSTNFRELKAHFSGGKPLVLYLCGQAFNLGLTLLMAYIMFYLVFPEITANI